MLNLERILSGDTSMILLKFGDVLQKSVKGPGFLADHEVDDSFISIPAD